MYKQIYNAFLNMVQDTFPYALSSVSAYESDNKDPRSKEVVVQLPVLPTDVAEPDAGAKSQTAQIIEGLKQFEKEKITILTGTWRMFGFEILPGQDLAEDGTTKVMDAEIKALVKLRKKAANATFRKLFTDLQAADLNADATTPNKDKVLQIKLPNKYTFDDLDAAIGEAQEYLVNYEDKHISGINLTEIIGIVGMKSNRIMTKYRYTMERTSVLFAALMKPSLDVNDTLFWLDAKLNNQTVGGQKTVAELFHKEAIYVEDPMKSMIKFDDKMVGNKVVGLRYRDVMGWVKKGAAVVITQNPVA